MDKFEEIAAKATLPVCIVGNAQTGIFELVSFPLPNPVELTHSIQARGFGLIGVVGIRDGSPVSAFTVALDEAAGSALAAAYVDFLTRTITATALAAVTSRGLDAPAYADAQAQENNDFAGFAAALFALEDPR